MNEARQGRDEELAAADPPGISIPRTALRLPPLTLTVVLSAALIGAWWLSLRVLVGTRLMDLTFPKIAVLVGLLLLVVTAAWRTASRRDIPVLAAGGLLLAWLVGAAVLRRDSTDLKLALAFAVFAGGAFLIAFAAVRTDGERALRALGVVLGLVTAIAFASVVFQRVVYLSGVGDHFVWLWSIFRPQSTYTDPILGTIAATPAYFSGGGLLRASGFFAHPNYEAFFSILVAPFFAIRLCHAIDDRSRRATIVNGLLLIAIVLVDLWTYSRTGIVGMIGSSALAVLGDRVLNRRPSGRLFGISPLPAVAVGLIFAVTLGAGIFQDPGSAQRISTVGDVTISTGADQTNNPGPDVQTAAVRSQDIRVQMQKAAVKLMIESAKTALLGPGMTTYEKDTHDTKNKVYVSQAAGIRDPNSAWLSFGLAGGIPGLALFALVLLAALAAALRAMRSARGISREMATWLAAWIVVWAGAQIFGTYPFASSESILLGAMLGIAAALLPRTAVQTTSDAGVGVG